MRPEVKDRIASNPRLLTALLSALESHPDSPEISIGGLSILANLTHYAPTLSDEQRKMSQLRAYANATRIEHEDDDAHVESRCKALVSANVVSVLVKLNKTPSSGTAQLTDKILLSLSRTKTDRGKIAQQGAVKLLILHCQRASQNPHTSTHPQIQPQAQNAAPDSIDAAHALARILISLNPAHVFSGALQITSAIPPLMSLLKSEASPLDNAPRDLLPVFEALLALTNLASSPNPDVALGICKNFDEIEDRILSSNVGIRRAAVELVCNLVAFPGGMVLYADGSKRALERLRILVAMGDVDDAKTRSASGGALAMLSDIEEVREALVGDEKITRTVEVVLEMVCDGDLGIKHRGFVILGNLMEDDNVKEIARRLGGVNKTKEALKNVREQAVLEIGVGVLKELMGK